MAQGSILERFSYKVRRPAPEILKAKSIIFGVGGGKDFAFTTDATLHQGLPHTIIQNTSFDGKGQEISDSVVSLLQKNGSGILGNIESPQFSSMEYCGTLPDDWAINHDTTSRVEAAQATLQVIKGDNETTIIATPAVLEAARKNLSKVRREA